MGKGRRADRSDRRNRVLFLKIFQNNDLIKWKKETRKEEKKTEGMTITEDGMMIGGMKEDGKKETIITSQENDPNSHSLP